MKNSHLFIRVLALAAAADWLITRTITRAAIHMPKSEALLSVYRGLNVAGQLAGTFVSLLAVLVLAGIAWHAWRARRAYWLAITLSGQVTLSLAFLVSAPNGWLAVSHHLLTIALILLMIAFGPGSRQPKRSLAAAAILLPALALLGGQLYQLLPALLTVLSLPGPTPLTGWFFMAGEFFVVLSAFGLWWAYGRVRSVQIWVTAALPPLLFVLAFLRAPAMTGILSIWSTGLSLYLPWPLYALALWLTGTTILATWKANPPIAYALLLLTAAGFAPQMSTQLFSALIALWLLTWSPQLKHFFTDERRPPSVFALSSDSTKKTAVTGTAGGGT